MLNIDFIEKLYKNLPREKKHELKKKLFGGSNQSLTYFRKNKDTSMSKLEILADFFSIPLDGLRADSNYVYDNRIKRIIHANSIIKDSSFTADIAKSQNVSSTSLELERLQLQTEVLKETIAVREERIEVLLDRIAVLQEKFELSETNISR